MVTDRVKLYRNLPETPGVYLMYGAGRKLLYIGKAASLKRRVSSYFTRPHDDRIESLVSQIRRIETRQTATALEALILESLLIKKYQPPYNIREKDDRSFLFIEITREKFPRVLLVRGKQAAQRSRGKVFGPFTSASSVREALRILRRVFPWSVHDPAEEGKFKRPCFDAEIGLCPGTCIGTTDPKAYRETIRNLVLVLSGKTQAVFRSLEREMQAAAKKLEFEEAARIRRQVFALRHVRDVALIGEDAVLSGKQSLPYEPQRIEGYDISNISGTSAVGSMVVFTDGEPDKNEYRKFRIRTVTQSDDTAMLREVLLRRFGNDWPLPNLVLVDGGRGQVHAAERALSEAGFKIPLVGIAKGPERKKNEFIGAIPKGFDERVLIRVRDEAHRFAISYHRTVRGRSLLG